LSETESSARQISAAIVTLACAGAQRRTRPCRRGSPTARFDHGRHRRDVAAARTPVDDQALAFFRLQRAAGVDQPPAGGETVGGGVEEPRLQGGLGADVALGAVPGDVGVTPERARGGAGGVDQHDVERALGELFERGDAGGGGEPEPGEVRLEPRHAAGVGVQRGHLAAGVDQLRRLAARRRTCVEHAPPGEIAQARHRQAGGHVLHPPGALGVARELLDRAGVLQPDARGAEWRAAQALGPAVALLRDGEVEGRLGGLCRGDGARGGLAVGGAPAAPEPGRQIARDVRQLGPLGRDLPEDGVDQPGLRSPPGAGQRHARADGGVRRRLQQQDLRRPQAQEVLRHRRVGRVAQIALEHAVELALAAQDRGDEAAGEGAVAPRQTGGVGQPGEGVLQTLGRAAEDGAQHVEGRGPRAVGAGARRGLRRAHEAASASASAGSAAANSPASARRNSSRLLATP
jgi:hypothetical protein